MKYFNKTLKWHNVLINEVLVFKRKTKKRQKITQMRTVICGEDVTKLKKLRLPEPNKYLNYHGLRQHLKSSKSDKVKTIERRSCLQQNSPLTAGQPTLRNVRTLAQSDNRASADSIETDESGNEEYDSDTIDPGEEDDSSDIILAFINSDEEDANDRPNATRSEDEP